MKTTRTAIYRFYGKYGVEMNIMYQDGYRSERAFAHDLRNNGYKVVHIFNHYADDREINDWLHANRKRG